MKWDFHTEFIGACRRRALLADLMHELIHATAHEKLCGRTVGKRFGDEQYAFEKYYSGVGQRHPAHLAWHRGRIQVSHPATTG
ncbi:zincin-like metallopeptidase domain-containing protein [Mesorhizobium sp. M0601]|uniref:zincin-like metallopeptidase domain-containing protein n=1 Tax=Mesorhizobium sp. M0601 TaxID=2956969 RepID=UPI00333C1874